MFTGIIEEKGTVQAIQKQGKTIHLLIGGKEVLADIKLGDSIAVNGACLTVTSFDNHSFQVDVMPETFEATSLVHLSKGAMVNLERAMAANSRFGGHFVSGHVDCTGKIVKKEQNENAVNISIDFPEIFSHLLLEKGSVALDGTSLTIFATKENQLTVSLIPHTSEHTVLGGKMVGDLVNIEFDMIGKYLYSYFSKMDKNTPVQKGISKDFLIENGF